MSQETALKVFPIVHQYGMQLILGWCIKAIERTQLNLWPSEPILSSEVLNHLGLVQCLALADAKQCDSLVQSCLSQLIKPGSSDQIIRRALISPNLNHLVGNLRPETKDKIILGLVGLPEDFKVGLSTQALFVESYDVNVESFYSYKCPTFQCSSCFFVMHDPCLLDDLYVI